MKCGKVLLNIVVIILLLSCSNSSENISCLCDKYESKMVIQRILVDHENYYLELLSLKESDEINKSNYVRNMDSIFRKNDLFMGKCYYRGIENFSVTYYVEYLDDIEKFIPKNEHIKSRNKLKIDKLLKEELSVDCKYELIKRALLFSDSLVVLNSKYISM